MAYTTQQLDEMRSKYGLDKAPTIGTETAAQKYQRMRTAPTETEEPGLGSKLMGRLGDIGTAIKDVATLKIPIQQGALRAAGAIAGGGGDILGAALEPVVKPAVEKIAETETGKAALGKVSDIQKGYSEWATKHPEAAKDLEATANIASILPVGKLTEIGLKKAGETAAGQAVKESAKKTIAKVTAKSAEKDAVKIAELVSEVPTKKTGIAAIEKTGGEESLLGGYKIPTTASDLKRAKSVSSVVDPKASKTTNIKSLNKEISRVSEEEVRPGLKDIPSDPVESTVARLKSIEKPDIVVADTTLDRTYDLVRNRMIQQIEKQPPTLEGLLDARQGFDKMIVDQFGDAAFNSEKNTAIKRAVRDMRTELNKIISEKAPQYAEQMSRLTDMYDARYNLAEKIYADLNKGGYSRLKTLYPKTTKTAQLTAGAAGLGLTGAYIKGLLGD